MVSPEPSPNPSHAAPRSRHTPSLLLPGSLPIRVRCTPRFGPGRVAYRTANSQAATHKTPAMRRRMMQELGSMNCSQVVLPANNP